MKDTQEKHAKKVGEYTLADKPPTWTAKHKAGTAHSTTYELSM